jgi:hypothetical protein
MDYGKIFARGWEVFWKHKILWVFGIIGGISSIFSSLFNYFRYDFNFEDIAVINSTDGLYTEEYRDLLSYAYEHTALFVILLILGILLMLTVSYLVYAYGYTGMIRGVLMVEQGTEKLTFREIHESIRPFFWRIFGLNLLLGVGGMGLVFVLMAIMFVLMIFTLGIGMICFFPLICLTAPVMWFLTIVVIQALVALIAEDLSIKDSLVRAWQLVTKNIGPYLLVWLLVFIISLLVGLVISLPSLVPMFSMWATMISPDFYDNPTVLFEKMGSWMMWAMIWTPVIVVLRGIQTTFTTSIWTQTYLEAREDGTLEDPDQPNPAELNSESLE